MTRNHEQASKDLESGTNQALSVDFRTNPDNANVTDLFVSADRSHYNFVASIPGFPYSVFSDPNLPGHGLALVAASQSYPPEISLWNVSSRAEYVQHFIDLPTGLLDCKINLHKSVINLHCFDTDYYRVSYQISRDDKTTISLLAKLGYIDDSTHRFAIQPLQSQQSSLDLIEVRKIAKADSSDEKLVDLYIYLNESYQKIEISPADLGEIERSNLWDIDMGTPSLLAFGSHEPSTQRQNLLTIDISNTSALTLSRYFFGTNNMNLVGVMNGSLILNDNGTLKALHIGTGISDINIYIGQPLGIAGNKIYFFDPWVYGQAHPFKVCDINQLCETIFADFTGYDFLTSPADDSQQKLYFKNSLVSEASRVIESMNLVTHSLAVESKLGATLATQGITVASVESIKRENGYLVVYYRDPDSGKKKIAILDGASETYLDSFVEYCYASPEEQDEYMLKYHKYLTPKEGAGLILVQRGFGCS